MDAAMLLCAEPIRADGVINKQADHVSIRWWKSQKSAPKKSVQYSTRNHYQLWILSDQALRRLPGDYHRQHWILITADSPVTIACSRPTLNTIIKLKRGDHRLPVRTQGGDGVYHESVAWKWPLPALNYVSEHYQGGSCVWTLPVSEHYQWRCLNIAREEIITSRGSLVIICSLVCMHSPSHWQYRGGEPEDHWNNGGVCCCRKADVSWGCWNPLLVVFYWWLSWAWHAYLRHKFCARD